MGDSVTGGWGRPKRSIWRHALALVAAYLLVLQAALAGGAMDRMQAHGGFAAEIICLNTGSASPADDGAQTAPFDCCGLGCLVGAQTLQSPGAPDQALVYPADRRFETERENRAAPSAGIPDGGLRSRGPPAIG